MTLYKPSKVLSGFASTSSSYRFWPYDDGLGDPYWEGGPSPKPYQWEVSIDIETQEHSSYVTREDGLYNGYDVNIGDWVADKSSGLAMKIVQIQSKTPTRVVVILEDVYRYNLFRSSTASGSFPIPSNVIVFELNVDDMPLVDPIPSGGVGNAFSSNLWSRFQSYIGENNVLLEKPNHGFKEGDIIAVDPQNNTYVKSSDNFRNIIGRVNTRSIGPNAFIIDPFNTVVSLDSLIGNVGDTIYSEKSGNGLTLTDTGIPVYIKLTEYTNTRTVGSSSAGTTSGNIIIINDVEVTVGGSGSVSDAVSAINLLTSSHNVTASEASAPNSVSNTEGFSYGEPAAFVSTGPQISINGVTVTLTTTTEGDATYPSTPSLALEEDIAADINAANIPDIIAEGSDNTLTIRNTSGGSITLSNVTNDDNGTPIFSPSAGSTSCTGVVVGTYSASTDVFLVLENTDASEIEIKNKAGNATNILDDFGIYTVENGQKAKAIYVADGIRKGQMTTVSNNTQRMNLSAIEGDSAYVLDSGNGEWSYWIYTSTGWVMVADEDSARTDADVLSIELTNADSGSNLVGTVSSNSRVTDVTVEVTEAFDDINATLNIGDVDVNDRLMSEDIIDLTETGTYTFTPSHVYNSGGDTDLNAYLNPASSTQGSLKVIISYS